MSKEKIERYRELVEKVQLCHEKLDKAQFDIVEHREVSKALTAALYRTADEQYRTADEQAAKAQKIDDELLSKERAIIREQNLMVRELNKVSHEIMLSIPNFWGNE